MILNSDASFAGSEGSAMATCPSPVLGSFTYTYYDGSTACGTDSDWDGCSDSSRISLNYTLCNKVVLYSGKVIVFCDENLGTLVCGWSVIY